MTAELHDLALKALADNPAAEPASLWVLTDAMPQMVWSTRPDGHHDYFNARWYEFTGVPEGSTDGEEWAGMFHEDDQPKAWARWRHSLTTGDPYEVEYRLRHRTGDYRWTIGRAMPIRDADGKIIRWIGTCTDIHDAKHVAEQNELLSRELAHRIKNIFAVISGLIGLSARKRPEAKAYAEDLRERIAALGRAHEFVRPHSDESKPSFEAAELMFLLEELLSAYPALSEGRISITGDSPKIDDRSATPLALAIHELATNSAKYGALADPAGSVSVDVRSHASIVEINWTEQGGVRITQTPSRSGFGTRLLQLAIEAQVRGTIERSWEADGLRVKICFPQSSLLRGAPIG